MNAVIDRYRHRAACGAGRGGWGHQACEWSVCLSQGTCVVEDQRLYLWQKHWAAAADENAGLVAPVAVVVEPCARRCIRHWEANGCPHPTLHRANTLRSDRDGQENRHHCLGQQDISSRDGFWNGNSGWVVVQLDLPSGTDVNEVTSPAWSTLPHIQWPEAPASTQQQPGFLPCTFGLRSLVAC